MEHALEHHTRIKRPQEETIGMKGRGRRIGHVLGETVSMEEVLVAVVVEDAMEAIKGMEDEAVIAIEHRADVATMAMVTAVAVAIAIGRTNVTARGARAGAGREVLAEEVLVIILGIVVTVRTDLPVIRNDIKRKELFSHRKQSFEGHSCATFKSE